MMPSCIKLSHWKIILYTQDRINVTALIKSLQTSNQTGPIWADAAIKAGFYVTVHTYPRTKYIYW